MSKPFNPEDGIPAELWMFVGPGTLTDAAVQERLNRMERQHIVRVYVALQDASTEMRDRLEQQGLVDDATEDTLDDLAHAIVLLGRKRYLEVYYGREQLPHRETWEDLPTVGHVFIRVFSERFGVEIDDCVNWDDLTPMQES